MRIAKGNAGYIRSKKKWEITKTCIEFGMVIVVFLTGYLTTKTRLNLLTVAAVLGCLPAAKALVGVIMLFPHQSIQKEKLDEIEKKAPKLVKSYDMILTSYEKIMPIDSIVIFKNVVCGYTSSDKVDVNNTALYIKKMLRNNKYDKVFVKIFADYKMYLTRVEDMQNMAEVEKEVSLEHEEGIKRIILSLSM